MRAADTNVLVRLIVRDDPAQVRVAEAFVRHGAWVSHLALAECVWVLSSVYDFEAVRVATVVEVFLAHKNLTLQDPDVVAAALGHFRKKPSLGFSDCLMLEVARRAGHLPFGTFDRNLGKLDGAEAL
jgi:predicted nucleic-acid-binding protein